MLKQLVQKRLFVTSVFVFSLLVLLSIGLISLNVVKLWTDDRVQVLVAREMLMDYERLISTLKDAETGQRGYLLTGDSTYLEPYLMATDSVDVLIAKIDAVSRDSARRANITRIKALTARKLREIRATINRRNQSGLIAGADAVQTNLGKQLMDTLRTEVQQLQTDEQHYLDSNKQALDIKSDQLTYVQICGSLVSIGLLVWVFVLLRQQMGARLQDIQALENAKENLETKVLERTDELNTAVEEITATNEELSASHEHQEGLLNQLTQAQQELQMAFEASRMGTWVWHVQNDTIEWSESLEPLHGLQPGEFQSVYGGNFEGFQQLIHPEDVPHLQEKITRSLLDKTDYQVEFRVVWPDGTVRWIFGRGRGVYNQQGEPLRMLGVAMDVNERKHAEEKLAESQRQFQFLAEFIPHLVWRTQPNGDHEYFNRQWYEYTGLSYEETKDRGWSLVLHPDDYERTLAVWQHSLLTGKMYDIEYRFRRADGTYRWFLGRALPMYDEQGNVRKWFGTCTDIDDQKKAMDELSAYQQELMAQQRQTEQALATIAKDNQRKTRELEEARIVQMSMLPQAPPVMENVDMAMFMKTCAEVGGDYYDYKLDAEGNLTVVVGDATGHGLKAGIVVATVKSYFHTLVNQCSPVELLRRISEGIQNLQIRGMYMGLTVIRMKGNQLEIASSGMPPLYLYQAACQRIEPILLKGLFLGSSLQSFNGQNSVSIQLAPGDTLLAMSDGLAELHNHERDMLDYARIEACYGQTASLSAAQVVHHLHQLGEKWLAGQENADDITLVVIKAKTPASSTIAEVLPKN